MEKFIAVFVLVFIEMKQIINLINSNEKISLEWLDGKIQKIYEKNIKPDLILCRFEQYDKLNELLIYHQRFMSVINYKNMQVASYHGIPIFPLFGGNIKCKMCGNEPDNFIFNFSENKVQGFCVEHYDTGRILAKFERKDFIEYGKEELEENK